MQNLAKALAGFHADVGPIHKTSDAQYGKYADLATVLTTVGPVLSRHGLVITQTFMPFEAGATVLRTTLLHSSGEAINSDLLMPATEGARNALHAFGAATTYLRRYALLAMLNLAAEDDDGESFAAEPKAVTKPGTGTQRAPSAKRPPTALPSADLLSRQESTELLAAVKALGPDTISKLANAFRQRFDLPEGPVSDYIKTKAHATFITEWIAALNGAAVPA